MGVSKQLRFESFEPEFDQHVGQILALSLSQPYANWVASGTKSIETRTWSTKHRGDLLICAAKSGDRRIEPRGVALCVVKVASVVPMTQVHEQPARVTVYPNAKAWHLTDRRVLKDQFPVRGMPGLFYVDMSAEIQELVD